MGITTRPRPALLQAIKSTVYPYGRPTDSLDSSLLRSLTLNIPAHPCEAYAFISPSSSRPCASEISLSRLLLGQYRFSPTNSISWPFARGAVLDERAGLVKFEAEVGGGGGDFTDFTERYFAKREEGDGKTLREDLLEGVKELTEDVTEGLELRGLLDYPVRALSNGQRRRARIAKMLLQKKDWIILEDCFAGLDPPSREHLSSLLQNLHRRGSPFVSLILQPHEHIPSFITHVGLLSSSGDEGKGTVFSVVPSSEYRSRQSSKSASTSSSRTATLPSPSVESEILVRMENVNVIYENERHVLKNINWCIRQGEKWSLKGHNGSGKTTLLAMLSGDHPKSYQENITIFGRPRASQATVYIQQNLGHLSPELSRSFPRRLSVLSTLSSGFHSVFSHRPLTDSQRETVDELLDQFPTLPSLKPLLQQPLSSLSIAQQQFTLFLRAVISKPKLLILDEPFAGMDGQTVEVLKRWLDRYEGSVVLVSHRWEEEWPEKWERKTLELKQGDVRTNDSVL
ncbi:P-loop containing nucleoside triphosphate hydrolase protein [Atractiella rhizophila]|nr:P-loop containing nucleoside triphosphate hydrolase protein [Atractiella rhizophila]